MAGAEVIGRCSVAGGAAFSRPLSPSALSSALVRQQRPELVDREVSAYPTVDEPARELIRLHAARIGDARLDRRPERFLRMLVERSIQGYNSVPDTSVVFFDRGLPDCLAYAAVYGLDPGPLRGMAAAFRYDSPVFIAPPWLVVRSTAAQWREPTP